ncbi:MAG: DUF4139 domain-containing protein [Fimbriimonadaceae bacterium]|nr:DUF4139 domain-containing protein [Fimbriimonadaceae bacterium]
MVLLSTAITLAAAIASAPESSELTIYNGGFALVKEHRSLDLKAGVQSVGVEDVAQQIEANSVAIKSLSAPGSFNVLEQNYQYDLISPAAILQKAVGQPVTFIRTFDNGKKDVVHGTLLSSPMAVVSMGNGASTNIYNGMVIRTDDGKILLNPVGEIQVDKLPAGLISKPTLMWMLDSEKAGRNNIELRYLTRGMSWQSDYVLSLDKDGRVGDLQGWVTLTNNSGATFENTKLKLVAGDVNRVVQQMGMGGLGGGGFGAAKPAAPPMTQEQFADYHLYTLTRPATVRNNEMKQVSLLEASGVKVTKKLLVDAMWGMGTVYPNEGVVGTGPIKPVIFLQIKNSKENQLGMPLPKGTFKVFQTDSSGSLQMLGEDAIDHTPKEEEVSLRVGNAFDIVVERKRTSFEWIRRGWAARESFEIELRNRKETPETVHVWERHWGDHKVIKQSMDGKWLDSQIYEFVVDLKPNEVKTVTYTIETEWD